MPIVPKKPNKRRKKKTTNPNKNTNPDLHVDLGYQRFLQANAIREQIRKNIGDIFDDLTQFESSLTLWTSTGKDAQGKCEIPRLQKEMEWRFHSNIMKYPEVWFRNYD